MVYKVNNEEKYEVVLLNKNRYISFDDYDDFMFWLVEKTVRTDYYSGRYYLDFGDFNFSGNDLGCYIETFFYEHEREVTYRPKNICVYRNGVLFDVRTLKKEILSFRVSNPHLFSYYRKKKETDNDAEYCDIFVKSGYRNNCKMCYAYRKDPVPYVSHGNGRGRSSKNGNVIRMVHAEG
jgi:hypothetical protein